MTIENQVDQKEQASRDDNIVNIRCEDIRLISSSLKFMEEVTEEAAGLGFGIRVVVDKNKAFGYLDVKLQDRDTHENETTPGYILEFALMGSFIPDNSIPDEDLAEFAKLYTLSILWPYAREYISDVLRRAGEIGVVLPIINPQIVTEELVATDSVQITIHQDNEKE